MNAWLRETTRSRVELDDHLIGKWERGVAAGRSGGAAAPALATDRTGDLRAVAYVPGEVRVPAPVAEAVVAAAESEAD